MTMEEASKSLGAMTEGQLKDLISTHNSGKEIAFDIKHVYGELLFRDMMRQWDEDTEELEERERSKDDGCGHDQNEDYYGKE
jgi:hypothetical protein